MSKENRAEGQKMDHKRIWVTQPQLQGAGVSSAYRKEQRMPFFLHSQRNPRVPWINTSSQQGLGWFSLTSHTEQEMLASAPG